MDARQRSRVTDATALQPPGQKYDATADTPENNRWLWVALAGLVLLGLGVIFALPGLVGPAQEEIIPTQPLPPAGNAGDMRDTAQQTLQTYLQLRARLELDNAGAWGEPRWSNAAALASAADRYFAQRQFTAAARDYQAALDNLQQLDANRSGILAAALEAADHALTGHDVDTAIAQFELALAIEQEHPAATRGLAQANSRRAVIEQMNRARAAETSGDLEAAAAAYQQAIQLDAAYVPAREALQRVTGQINARDFSAAMTRALAALDSGQVGAAGKALAEAERLQPGNTAVRDGRARLQGIRAQAGLNSLRRQAAGEVASEDWQAAISLYRKALAIDPSAGFASEGLRRAEERSTLHAQFDHYLDTPARIYSAVPLANAGKLLAAASEAPPDEPRLARKITALRELVAGASMPMTVTLNSDDMTSVVIYRVGRLGQFNSHQLELLPGDYTVVGKRPGYRDVRTVITVRPGVPVPPLMVRCEEKI